MLNFFAIVLIIFIAILLLVFKKRSFKKLINKGNLYSVQLKKNRDNESVKIRLKKLKTLARSNNNIIPGLIKCVQNACTLGEMSDALREVYGDHTQ